MKLHVLILEQYLDTHMYRTMQILKSKT